MGHSGVQKQVAVNDGRIWVRRVEAAPTDPRPETGSQTGAVKKGRKWAAWETGRRFREVFCPLQVLLLSSLCLQ